MFRSCFLFLFFAFCSGAHIDQTELPSASIDPVGSEIIVFDVDADNNSNTLELICTGDGDLRWYRGDFEPLPDSTVTPINNNTLRLRISPIINNTDATHDGIPYFCVANNSLGSARSRTKLVKFAFFDGFEVQNTTTLINVTMTQPVAISCGVRNTAPPPIIVWYKDNEVLDTTFDTDKIRTVDDGNTLVIYNLETDDITSNGSPAEYRCGVTNVRMFEIVNSTEVFNLVEETFGFLVYHLPMNVTVTVSEAEAGVTFYYIAATDGNTRILPDFSGSINFDTFSVVYTGSKTMSLAIRILKGDDGVDDSRVSFTITVIEPLVVIERPSEVFNTTNVFHRFTEESISFTCSATGTGVQVQWYHNADLLDVSTSVLNFTNLTANQSGVYQCLWEESANGSFASDTWALAVQTPVPPNNISITSSGPNYSGNRTIVTAGEDVTLTLVFTADTLPNVTWKFNNDEVIELVNNTGFNVTGPFEISENPNRYKIIFTIRDISAINSGLYYATIDDGRTDPVEGPEWFVYQEVTINIISFNITTPYDCLLDDTKISLQCIVEGLPEPVVTFQRGSDEFTCDGISCNISTEDNEFVTTRILTFNDPVRSDQGMYACSADNDVSDPITQNLFDDDDDLLYCAIPRILNSSNNISILEGGDVFINCTIESSPDADVTWYKDGVQVTEADNSRIDIQIEDGSRQDVNLYELIIRNVIVSDSAVYECSAINTIIPSSVSAAITLNVTTDIVEIHVTTEASTVLPAYAPIVIGVGGGSLLILFIASIVCICFCCVLHSSKHKGTYATGQQLKDFTDGRGNVDRDSDEEETTEQLEAFQPQYESLPALRPSQPPEYKPSPAYNQFNPGDDFDIVKPPIPDNDSSAFDYHPQYYPPPPDNNGMMTSSVPVGGSSMRLQARFDDFISDDGQFV